MDTASILVIFGALVFAVLLLIFAVFATRNRVAGTTRNNAASDGDGAFVVYADSGGAHVAVDSSCSASHSVDCGSSGH